jgi:hypothetical protein
MNYTINPCKACSKKLQSKGCDINDLNDCYLETLASYKNNHNNFVILDDVDSNWKECMSNKMSKLPYVAGKQRSFSNFQLNRAPVFISGNHYFPNQLNDNNGDAEKALNMCKLQCKNSKLYNTCVENCQVDYDALVPQNSTTQLRKNNKTEDLKEMYDTTLPKDDDNNINDIIKEHPVTFYITFSIVSLLFAIIIFVFLYTLKK